MIAHRALMPMPTGRSRPRSQDVADPASVQMIAIAHYNSIARSVLVEERVHVASRVGTEVQARAVRTGMQGDTASRSSSRTGCRFQVAGTIVPGLGMPRRPVRLARRN